MRETLKYFIIIRKLNIVTLKYHNCARPLLMLLQVLFINSDLVALINN